MEKIYFRINFYCKKRIYNYLNIEWWLNLICLSNKVNWASRSTRFIAPVARNLNYREPQIPTLRNDVIYLQQPVIPGFLFIPLLEYPRYINTPFSLVHFPRQIFSIISPELRSFSVSNPYYSAYQSCNCAFVII